MEKLLEEAINEALLKFKETMTDSHLDKLIADYLANKQTISFIMNFDVSSVVNVVTEDDDTADVICINNIKPKKDYLEDLFSVINFFKAIKDDGDFVKLFINSAGVVLGYISVEGAEKAIVGLRRIIYPFVEFYKDDAKYYEYLGNTLDKLRDSFPDLKLC